MAESSSSHHPAQEQDRQPGRQEPMRPTPQAEIRGYRGAGRQVLHPNGGEIIGG